MCIEQKMEETTGRKARIAGSVGEDSIISVVPTQTPDPMPVKLLKLSVN